MRKTTKRAAAATIVIFVIWELSQMVIGGYLGVRAAFEFTGKGCHAQKES